MVSYKKLWHLLLDRNMRKQDLSAAAKISTSVMAKLSKGENVQTEILVRICKTLNCDFADIMEIVPDKD